MQRCLLSSPAITCAALRLHPLMPKFNAVEIISSIPSYLKFKKLRPPSRLMLGYPKLGQHLNLFTTLHNASTFALPPNHLTYALPQNRNIISTCASFNGIRSTSAFVPLSKTYFSHSPRLATKNDSMSVRDGRSSGFSFRRFNRHWKNPKGVAALNGNKGASFGSPASTSLLNNAKPDSTSTSLVTSAKPESKVSPQKKKQSRSKKNKEQISSTVVSKEAPMAKVSKTPSLEETSNISKNGQCPTQASERNSTGNLPTEVHDGSASTKKQSRKKNRSSSRKRQPMKEVNEPAQKQMPQHISQREKPLKQLYPPSGKSVMVVESVTKAKVIQRYLGDMFEVLPSFGHVRDLVARSGSVRPDDDFSMVWEVPSAAWTHLKSIKVALSGTMPRKVNYGVDYDDGYDDYGYEVEENVEAPSDQETINHGVWRCSVCTYDNDETMSACDICGVLRGPLVNNCTYDDKRKVDGICKDSEVSIMAKSLFASLPHQVSRKVVDSQQQNDDFVVKEDNNFHSLRNNQGQFHEFHKAYSSPTHSRINIAPFRFDVPSPDDVVSNGLHSSKLGSKVNIFDLKSSRVPSSAVGKNEAVKVQSRSKRSDSSYDSKAKDKHNRLDDIIFSKNLEVDAPSGSRTTGNSSASMPKGRLDSVDESSVAVNLKSSGKSSSSLMPKERNDMVDDNSSSGNGGEAHSLASNLKNMSLAAKPKHSNDTSPGRAHSRAQYEPETWMLPEKAEDSLTQLNLAIVGHVDSGKSTLSGRLLHLLGRISQKEMHKYEKESKLQGKGSFAYAWALDESTEERERGITMTVAVAYFDSKRYHVVVLDSPGHKDFVPNMITGATQADAAILVIDASIGSFEAGMDGAKGQTREHAQLIRSFGVDQIIVAVNKMDAVDYSKDRFDLIKLQLGTFLRSCGFKDSSVSWIPLSVVENLNLVAAPSEVCLSWYRGPYLLEAIDSFQPPTRDFSKPLLMPICDVIKSLSQGQGQVSACGKLEAGAVRSGSKVLVMPSANIATVRSLERDSQACTIARAGDNVAVNLHGIDGNHVMAGGVLCHPDFPVAIAKHLELKVLVLDGATPILIGSQLEFHIHHAKEVARVARISSLHDSKTGKITKKAPRFILAKQSAVVEVILHEAVCVEEFSKCKALGRVFLRTLGRTVAMGIVTRIVEEQ